MPRRVSTEMPVPMPADWAQVHATLKEAWMIKNDKTVPQPPVPIILAGAAFSTASAIRRRWVELIEWANAYGFSDQLTSQMPPSPEIDVADHIAGVSENGRCWWPEYSYHEPKKKPSKEVVSATFEHLWKNWQSIVGAELAASTKPLRFSGQKFRRLLVSANPVISPPWGSWYSTAKNPEAFTAFRKAINNAIVPMEIDDITFSNNKWTE